MNIALQFAKRNKGGLMDIGIMPLIVVVIAHFELGVEWGGGEGWVRQIGDMTTTMAKCAMAVRWLLILWCLGVIGVA